MKRKDISIEEFSNGFQYSMNGGWREVTWEDPHWSTELELAASYMRCENGTCGNVPYHFPPAWEDYGEHERKHTTIFNMSDDLWDRLNESSERRKQQQIFPNIIAKYTKERDEA